MTRLLLWRHGQTAWNAAGRVQGQTDIDLTDLGRAQAEAAAPKLAEQHPDLIVSSDLRRAADTAAALAAITGLPVALDARLRERHHGIWEGLTNTEITSRWPAEAERWRAGLPVGLNIEEPDELGKRVVTALQDIAGRAPGATIVVTSHGAAIRRATGVLLGWPDPATRTLGAIANCHWVDLRLDPRRGWQLRAYNAG